MFLTSSMHGLYNPQTEYNELYLHYYIILCYIIRHNLPLRWVNFDGVYDG